MCATVLSLFASKLRPLHSRAADYRKLSSDSRITALWPGGRACRISQQLQVLLIACNIIRLGEALLSHDRLRDDQVVVQPEPAQREHGRRSLKRDDAEFERRWPDDGKQQVELTDSVGTDTTRARITPSSMTTWTASRADRAPAAVASASHHDD